MRLLDSGQPKSEAVLAYLAKAEAREGNPHLADDIRIAWLTVLHAAAGVVDAWGFAFWQFFGKTYPKALLAWAERDEINRKALERCAAMVRTEKEQLYGNTSQATPRIDQSASGVLQTRPSSAISSQPLSRVQADEPRSVRVADDSGKSSGANSVPVTNLYDSCREALALPPKKPIRRIAPRKKAA